MKMKIKNKPLWAYGAAIALTVLFFAVFVLSGHKIQIDADLTDMIPQNTEVKVFRLADKAVAGNSGKAVSILVSHEDFETARSAAVQAYEELKALDGFESLSLYSDSAAFDETEDFIRRWTPVLLNKEIQERLNDENQREAFIQEQNEEIYNPFTFASLENLEQDPFLLSGKVTADYLKILSQTGTGLSPKENVLASEYDNRWYILINGFLNEKGGSLGSKENAVPSIYEICGKYEKDGVRFVYSGTPFHSYKSSSSARREISWISTVSLAAVILILLFVFRSARPVLYSVGSILLSLGISFIVTLLVFKKIHVMTLVFGTTLIGSCIDYSIHYFIRWKFSLQASDGTEIRNSILKSMFLALLSTEICFMFLFFAPFELLRQMAVFCFTGILCAFLAAVCIYPVIKLPRERKELSRHDFERKIPVWLQYAVPAILVIFSVITLSVNHSQAGVSNNISRLYQMQGRLKDDTILASKVMNFSSGSWLIIQGDSQEELFENEEKIASQIGDGIICVTEFIPSIKKQKASLAACEKLFPYLEEQAFSLGYDEKTVSDYRKQINGFEGCFLTAEEPMPSFMKNFCSMLYIGQSGGKFYSIILPVNSKNNELIKKLADENDFVFYENKVQDINTQLNRLTVLTLKFLLAAVAIIFVVLKFFYSFKDCFRIIAVPLISLASGWAVFSLMGRQIDFFCVTGMILVFGLSLDYIIYKITDKGSPEENLSIILSFVTTLLSFGTLGFSSFVPVQTIGLIISLGLLSSFISVIFIKSE